MKFPEKIKIKIIEGFTRKPIKIPNIIISIHVFAMKKNDYYLGPFFSDEAGELEIDKKVLEISAEAELKTGIMDYRSINEGSPLIEIRIISPEEIASLLKGRELWGIIGHEKKLYNTKEELLERIRRNNNNLILPQSIRVIWNEDTPSGISYEIMTNLSAMGNRGHSLR